ncbi:MAG: DMT family transporter [Rhodobacteraceae bacterium]|nr:DMT family transporter [Paracoccaceae bacterium]
MAPGQIVALILLCAGGAAVAIQAPINGGLGRSLASPVAAAAVSFGVGFAALVLVTLVTAGTAPAGRLAGVPLWQLTGGFLGAFYVWSIISGIGATGALTALAAIILGQMVAGLTLDHLGAFGLPVHTVSPRRIAAVAMVAGGLILSRG